jgi:hypothetical protein
LQAGGYLELLLTEQRRQLSLARLEGFAAAVIAQLQLTVDWITQAHAIVTAAGALDGAQARVRGWPLVSLTV